MRAGGLPENVLADDAKVGRTVVHVGGHVGRAHEDHPQRPAIDQQLPAELFGREPRQPRLRQQRKGAVQQHACRHSDRDLVLRCHLRPPASRAATCSGGSRLVRRPLADHDTIDSVRQCTRFAAATARHHACASAWLRD